MRVTYLLLASLAIGCTSGGGFFRRDLGAGDGGGQLPDAAEAVDFAQAPDFAHGPDFAMPAANCSDGKKNGGESDVDCGGPCGGCPDGLACFADGDCANFNCSSALCCPGGRANCDAFAGNGCEVNLLADLNNCGACGNQCAFGQTCQNGNCVQMQQLTCSQAAILWCQSKGWSVPVGGEASGGRVYCTPGVDVGNDCNGCGDYTMIVWKAGAKPAYCMNFAYSTKAGRVYAGHNPCMCGDNLVDCGVWPIGNCIPD